MTFRLESVTSGAETLTLTKSERARRDGGQISIDRGSVVELYRVTATEVEQLFRLDQLPGRGDVVVRLERLPS